MYNRKRNQKRITFKNNMHKTTFENDSDEKNH